MIFLCTPIYEVGWIAVWITSIIYSLTYPLFYKIFKEYKERNKISKEAFERVEKERWFCFTVLAIFPLAAPTCATILIVPVIALLTFPLYFTFSFIYTILYSSAEKFERKLLAIYYGIPMLVLISLGITFKVNLYGSLSEFLVYYATEHLRPYLITFILCLAFFVVYLLIFDKQMDQSK
ncbi:MAG: hypothetical protein ABDH21_03115 [bacterium]